MALPFKGAACLRDQIYHKCSSKLFSEGFGVRNPILSMYIFLTWYVNVVCLFVCLFEDRVSLCSPGCPETHFLDQAGLKLRNLPSSASHVQFRILNHEFFNIKRICQEQRICLCILFIYAITPLLKSLN